MRRSLLAWCLTLLACNSSHHDQPSPTPAPPPKDMQEVPRRSVDIQVVHLDQPTIALPKQESFVVLDAGKGPRAVLRYELVPGTSASTVETKLRSRRQINSTWSAREEPPSIRNGFAVSVAERGKPLAFRALPGEVVGATNGNAQQYLETWRSLLENRRFSCAVDNRGQLGAIAFGDDPAGTRSADSKDEVIERLLGTSVPVPAEPVAIGAQWRVVTILRQRPAMVKQSATYTLVARTATRWTIAVAIQRVADEQIVNDPTLPKGATADLIALLRRYTGTLEVDPARPLPASGTLTVESRLHVRISLPGPHFEEQIFEDEGTVTLASELPK